MDEFIPIVAMLLTLGPLAILAVSFTPLGRALTARLRGDNTGIDEKLANLKEDLRQELLEEQTAQLEELHERLDFTERLLSESRRPAERHDRVVTPT